MITPPTAMIGAATIIVRGHDDEHLHLLHVVGGAGDQRRRPELRELARGEVPTRWKSAARTSRPKLIALRAPKYTADIEQRICTTVTASIQPPVRRM